MSQRNREKIRQLRTAPFVRPEKAEPTQTMKHLFSIKDFMKDASFVGNPRLASLAKRIYKKLSKEKTVFNFDRAVSKK